MRSQGALGRGCELDWDETAANQTQDQRVCGGIPERPYAPVEGTTISQKSCRGFHDFLLAKPGPRLQVLPGQGRSTNRVEQGALPEQGSRAVWDRGGKATAPIDDALWSSPGGGGAAAEAGLSSPSHIWWEVLLLFPCDVVDSVE